ncbi:hypothetical protein GCM10023185_30810 [Hymenobacter saemangeumensis]|uniref:Copper-binding protein MbnP-like domain-containing protein n=1 Tax=Hymenobacter saemangeumensis TaxID=1084522 RepID=A0ABP8IME6_9BACT
MLLRSLLVISVLLTLPGLRPVDAPARRLLRIKPMLGSRPLLLDGPAQRTSAGDELTVSVLRCYLGPLTLQFADGSTYQDPAPAHLLDAEDVASWLIELPGAPAKPLAAVSFRVGVDSATNVAGALGGPLDPALGMYWAWQSGYINAKLEGRSPSRPAAVRRAFSFHIGGYARPHATARTLRLPMPTPSAADTLTLLADVDRWVGAAPLAQTPDVLLPGPAAAVQAGRVAAMFHWPASAAKPSSYAPR